MRPILEQVRAEGYRDGAGQAGMICHDDAYYKGQCSAWAEAPSRFRWWLFGLACGGTAAGLIAGAFL